MSLKTKSCRVMLLEILGGKEIPALGRETLAAQHQGEIWFNGAYLDPVHTRRCLLASALWPSDLPPSFLPPPPRFCSVLVFAPVPESSITCPCLFALSPGLPLLPLLGLSSFSRPWACILQGFSRCSSPTILVWGVGIEEFLQRERTATPIVPPS